MNDNVQFQLLETAATTVTVPRTWAQVMWTDEKYLYHQKIFADVLGRGHSISFLTPNNTRVVAHHGSTVRLPCRVHKPPNSAMVSG